MKTTFELHKGSDWYGQVVSRRTRRKHERRMATAREIQRRREAYINRGYCSGGSDHYRATLLHILFTPWVDYDGNTWTRHTYWAKYDKTKLRKMVKGRIDNRVTVSELKGKAEYTSLDQVSYAFKYWVSRHANEYPVWYVMEHGRDCDGVYTSGHAYAFTHLEDACNWYEMMCDGSDGMTYSITSKRNLVELYCAEYDKPVPQEEEYSYYNG